MALWGRSPPDDLDGLRLTLGETVILWASLAFGCLCWMVVGGLLWAWAL